MPVSKDAKASEIAKFRIHEKDTGSAEVQIAILTQRINHLTDHFKAHAKDHHSRRGLIQMVAMRRRHLDYLKKRTPDKYREIIAALGIRK